MRLTFSKSKGVFNKLRCDWSLAHQKYSKPVGQYPVEIVPYLETDCERKLCFRILL